MWSGRATVESSRPPQTFEGGLEASGPIKSCQELGVEAFNARGIGGFKLNRRVFIQRSSLSAAALVSEFVGIGPSRSQTGTIPTLLSVETPTLTVAYEESGDRAGLPVVLLHGFPDDVRAWDDVTPPLTKARYRVLVPYLRGYGGTRFRDSTVPRMAEQAAILIHSYRHRNGNAPGEARFLAVEQQLAKRPKIHVPSIVLYGQNDGVSLKPPDESVDRELFTSLEARRVVPNAGHFLPREKPEFVSSAVLKLLENTK